MSAAEKYPATAADWIAGARPHTWANAFAPVIVGSGTAAYAGGFQLPQAILAFIVAWALIIGVNYANDYSDGIRGTDEDRSGPARLTGGGLARPEHVKYAAFSAFAVAGIAGIVLSLFSAWWFILVGAVCIAGAWFYTGGKNPYGYRGLGEVAVFIFFGLVAVMGTQYTQAGTVTWVGFAAAVAIGAISASVNLANNIRDIPSDRATGKITLAVTLGDGPSRLLFSSLTLVPFVVSVLFAFSSPWLLLGLVALPLTLPGIRRMNSAASGAELIPVLGSNGRAMLVWALVTAAVMFLLGG
ncbi:1,4-dihydroxy-2-naphthoate polyprenyltransferase [Corynebacterium yudongzhengii]|uniref:1,4-dihydroxy-2-naphthoate octaprenyltransferase n=1 Tax=Corynebacterium yudongzhengii TaxID=2080740 RepID=A0A2U1T9Q1_9CORY|nr:1,4-dihydroxy-2-naphthoate polyprenyltransferase [Corynebacterium yudongzhengii]AWB81180.1 1,4-dihydroxy-2-naphthoate polyprenyltransferase [Corynebacterium yudongzhengii]PWC02719.1 1,4-dihydroxy-2-naphthoate polyprenyltransferase [Corynebacterium yudongzhengii]